MYPKYYIYIVDNGYVLEDIDTEEVEIFSSREEILKHLEEFLE